MTALYDAYVAVDWSASSLPKSGADSIWLCVDGREPENHRTRHAATLRIRDVLYRVLREGRRTLIGFDFPFGYPHGFAEFAAPGPGPPWRRVWDLLSSRIRDDERNANNRFEVAAELNHGTGPFWGCPMRRQGPRLTTKRTSPFPHCGLAELRAVDRRTRGVQSVWKLGGAGSVGSQALLGIPRVAQLRADPALERDSRIWPFESGFVVPSAQIVFVEVWPRLVARATHPVKDAAQVAGVVRHWRRLDASGRLDTLFEPSAAPAKAKNEEGWIFGVTA